MTDASPLPILSCPRVELAELHADPAASPWTGIPGAALRDAVSGVAPEQATSVRAAWNAQELRLLFCAVDSHPWATLTERDALLYNEETVEAFLDPFGDLQSYFEFEVNPLNTVLDLVVRRTDRGLVKNFAWRCAELRTEVRKTATGWTAELSIPFLSLMADPPQAGRRWRANFCRIDRPPGRERELSAWSPPRRPQFHSPERFGILEFV